MLNSLRRISCGLVIAERLHHYSVTYREIPKCKHGARRSHQTVIVKEFNDLILNVLQPRMKNSLRPYKQCKHQEIRKWILVTRALGMAAGFVSLRLRPLGINSIGADKYLKRSLVTKVNKSNPQILKCVSHIYLIT